MLAIQDVGISALLLPADRGICGVGVHGLRGRDILELDGCESYVLLRAGVCSEE